MKPAGIISIENLIEISILIEIIRQICQFTNIASFSGPLTWGCTYLSIILIMYYCIIKKKFISSTNIVITLWFLWLIICIVRGFFSIEIVWDFKNLMNNIPCLVLPFFAVLFADPYRIISFLSKWNYFLIATFLLIITHFIVVDSVHFLIGPCFFLYVPLLYLIKSNKWRLLISMFLIIMFLDLGARSQIIKAVVCFCLMIGIMINGKIINFLIKIASMSFYILAIVLLYLGISGQFNIFDYKDHSNDNLVQYTNGHYVTEEKNEMSSDTRTFLYIDLIVSAIENDYVIWGRTPARGNDAPLFLAHMGTEGMTPDMRSERNKNEFCHPNIFTWMGLIGVILYACIYLEASILAVFFSKNSFIPFLGALTSFNWFFGWIENTNTYDMMNIGLWIVIAMCISPQFREMNDFEFKTWVNSIFSKQGIVPYRKLQIIKQLFVIKIFSKTYYNKSK